MRWFLVLLLVVSVQIAAGDERVKKCKPRRKDDTDETAERDANRRTDDKGEECRDEETYLNKDSFAALVSPGAGPWLIFFFTEWVALKRSIFRWCGRLTSGSFEQLVPILQEAESALGRHRNEDS
ncbi:hypothetical protein BC830DRAFT_1108138 [Chytriomyces sp. MP71]|nr:hypothetical protein BC830DRAFT_1108138 [Chytriomyces sp. MP71]